MNVLIVEDEKLAEEYLAGLLQKTPYDIHIAGKADSVKNAIKWFLKNPEPDLVFMDIDLGDGLCFEIFEVAELKCPIIFTTAYDEYAIKAFKVNSIDYLLKPVNKQELEGALDKLQKLNISKDQRIESISKTSRMLSSGYKERFIIKTGEHLKSIAVSDILFFVSKEKATFAGTVEKRSFLIDYTLDRLEEMLNPEKFFRINRQYIIGLDSIKDIISYSNSRLKLTIEGCDDRDIVVARDRVNDFKEWLDR